VAVSARIISLGVMVSTSVLAKICGVPSVAWGGQACTGYQARAEALFLHNTCFYFLVSEQASACNELNWGCLQFLFSLDG